MEAQQVRYATFLRRLGAHLIDSVILSIILIPVAFMFGGDIDGGFSTSLTLGEGLWAGSSSIVYTDIIPMILIITLWVLYGGTPGKLLLDCHIVDARSLGRISVLQAIIRYFGYLVSALPLMLGFLWIIWDRRHQGFHDKLARTVVIYTPDEVKFSKHDESQKSLDELMKESS